MWWRHVGGRFAAIMWHDGGCWGKLGRVGAWGDLGSAGECEGVLGGVGALLGHVEACWNTHGCVGARWCV